MSSTTDGKLYVQESYDGMNKCAHFRGRLGDKDTRWTGIAGCFIDVSSLLCEIPAWEPLLRNAIIPCRLLFLASKQARQAIEIELYDQIDLYCEQLSATALRGRRVAWLDPAFRKRRQSAGDLNEQRTSVCVDINGRRK